MRATAITLLVSNLAGFLLIEAYLPFDDDSTPAGAAITFDHACDR
jgi:hypothetical protein